MIHNKYLQAFLFDPQLKMRGMASLAGAVIVLIQLIVVIGQAATLHQLKEKRALVERLPAMEKALRSNTIVTDQGSTVAKVKLILEGASIREGVPTALIDGVVYEEGDSIGDYTIEKVLMEQGGKAILKNQETQETKVLVVPLPK